MIDGKLVLGHVGRGTGDHEPFDQRYPSSLLVNAGDIIDGAPIDALVIWGGEDISPSLYNSGVSRHCGATSVLSGRDRLEAGACKAAIDRGIPIIGVCRGAQLVCALAGGKLVQHVDGHGGTHAMTTDEGTQVSTSSVHHQMMYPWDVDHELIAWSTTKRSTRYMMGPGEEELEEQMVERPEPEVVWFPKIKALAIQGHPEFMRNPHTDEFVQYCLSLVDRFILGSSSGSVARGPGVVWKKGVRASGVHGTDTNIQAAE